MAWHYFNREKEHEREEQLMEDKKRKKEDKKKKEATQKVGLISYVCLYIRRKSRMSCLVLDA